MKKKLAALAGACIVATSSMADINVAWIAGGGFYTDAGITIALLDETNPVLAQLIYAPAASYSVADIAHAGDGFVDAGAGYQVLSSFLLSNPGTAASEWGDFSQSAAIYSGVNAGFVYARIFYDETPGNGSWFYYSPFQAVSTYDPDAPTFQVLQVNRDNTNGDRLFEGGTPEQDGSTPFTAQIIPEPSVFALLGLGGLVLVIRRRFIQA